MLARRGHHRGRSRTNRRRTNGETAFANIKVLMDGRLVLSGDTRQHGAVEASDALRAIEKYSGLGFAVLTNIRRQNPETAKDARRTPMAHTIPARRQ